MRYGGGEVDDNEDNDVYDYNYQGDNDDDDDNYVDKMRSDDDDKLALVRRGVSHIWCAPGGQMNIAGHI